MSSIIYEYNDALKEHNDSVIDKTDAIQDIINTSVKITEYLKYLRELYFEARNMVTVFYYPPKPKPNGAARHVVGKTSNGRKNEVMPLDDRIKILDGHSPKFVCNGQNNETGEKDFLSYLYQINENEYYLILEPSGGINRTRIIFLRSDDDLDYDGFINETLKYLELSNTSTINSPSIARLNHTTLEAFEKNISYVFNRNVKSANINQYTKENIDTLYPADVGEKTL